MLQGPLFSHEDPEPQKRCEKTYVAKMLRDSRLENEATSATRCVASGIYIWWDGPEQDGLS